MQAKQPLRGSRPYLFRAAWKRGLAGTLDALAAAAVRLVTLGRGLRPDPAVLAKPRSILVVRLDHLGDVLFSRPALAALRQAHPQARIAALVSAAGAQLLAGDPAVDECLVFDAPWFRRGAARPGSEGWLALVRCLRARAFDVSLDLRGDLRHHLLLWLAGVKVRIGYTATGGGFLLHLPLRLPAGVHEVERNLMAAAAAGAADWPQAYLPLALEPAERRVADQIWRQPLRRVVVHPAAGDPAKCWPLDRFAQVCRALTDAGCDLAVVGTSSEQDQASRLPGRNLCGRTTVRELAALISTAHLVVANDSGPAHVAVTQGVPVIMLWSETNQPEEWGPWGQGSRATVVRNPARPEAGEEVLAAARAWLNLAEADNAGRRA
ncbi:MAG: glycosyltransferase family 9 protein [candidate division FCPU426 bacterium]